MLLRTLRTGRRGRTASQRTRVLSLCFLLTASGIACSQPTPEEQVAQGHTLYDAFCASCHEIERGIGPKLTPEVLATRVSAGALFRYTRMNMPYEAGNTLTEAEYWAITAYLLNRHGLMDADIVLNPESAEGLLLGK